MDKTIRPRVSLILPVFNKEKYISHAIESCINQSYKNIEIILVDDKGSDRSIEIAQEYAQRDSRIKIVYNHSNLKTYHSRINGVKHASGEYIMFVDADDYLDLQACEACIEMFEKNKNLSFVMFNFSVQKQFNAQYDDWHTIPQELDKKVLGLQEFLGFCTNREQGGWFNIVAKMIKKDLFLHGMQLLYNDTPLMMGEDILETMELLFVSEYIGLLAKPMYFYRFNEVSSMNTRNQTTLLNMIKDLSIIQSKIKSLARLWNTNDYGGGGVINKSYVRYTEFARYMVLIVSSHKLHRRLEYELLKYKPLPRNIRRCFTLKFLIKRKYYSVLIRLSKANIIKTNT